MLYSKYKAKRSEMQENNRELKSATANSGIMEDAFCKFFICDDEET